MIPQCSGVCDSPSPTKPRDLDAEKTDICLICGDKGDSKRLVYCIQCKACAEHSIQQWELQHANSCQGSFGKSYCLEKLHRDDDGTIIWRCEDCAPNNPKFEPELLRKSERISHATEAKYNRMIMKMKSGAVRKQKSVRSSEGESAQCYRKNDNEKRCPILENENVLSEEPESPEGPLNMSSDKQTLEYDSEAVMPRCLSYPEVDKYSRAQPLSDPVWTGQFRLKTATHFRLVAYVSSKASSKVNLAVTRLPRLLDVEILLRCVIWPRSFDTFPPDGDSIALYFFPQYESDEMVFDGVLNDVIEQDLALKAVINNLELFIFSSHLLRPDDRRICKKYYLWGVFKPKPRN